MATPKSTIRVNYIFLSNVFLAALFLFVTLFLKNKFLNLSPLIFLFIPIVYVMKKNYKLNIMVKTTLFIFLELAVIAFCYKELRGLFPVPVIVADNVVGFPQFSGYPIYFDNFIFLIFAFSSFLAALYFTKNEKNK